MSTKTKYEPSIPNGVKIDRPRRTYYLALQGHGGYPGSLGAYDTSHYPYDQEQVTFVEIVLYEDQVNEAIAALRPPSGNVFVLVATDVY